MEKYKKRTNGPNQVLLFLANICEISILSLSIAKVDMKYGWNLQDQKQKHKKCGFSTNMTTRGI